MKNRGEDIDEVFNIQTFTSFFVEQILPKRWL